MKVICTRKNLNAGLANTTRIISPGVTLPILGNILLRTDEGRLKLSSTNLEMAVNNWVGAKIEEQGEITVPAKIFNDFVNNLVGEKITLSTKNQTLYLEAEKTQTHIKGLGAEEFPLIPKIGDEIYARVDAKTLQQAIKEVAFAASYSETQPEISGVLFEFEGNTLTLVTTDRYRLAERKLAILEEVKEPRRLIVPARAVNEIGRVMVEGVVEVFLSENQIGLRTTDIELISRLIEGQYPDYKQIIPKNFTTEAEVNRNDFIQSLKGASLFASDNNNVGLDINPQDKLVVVKAQSPQIGESEVWVEAEILGQKNTVVFNFRYLLECLNNLSDEKITLKTISPSSPAAMVPAGRENYLYVVMPIKV
jgi:DNA polymerase-3 subunit beta